MKNIFALGLVVFTANCFGQVPKSGIYNELILVRDEAKKTIIGYFNSSTGNGQISCTYEFKGVYKTINDKTINIIALWPDDDEKVSGSLDCQLNNKFRLKFEEDLPGDMACGGASQEGAQFEIIHEKDWKNIRIAKNEKTFFYKEPNEITKRKAYITEYDAVGVIREQGEWVLAEFCGKSITVGWIKKSSLYPLK